MSSLPLVVMGASAGGIPALRALLGQLPADFPAAVLIVQHIAPDVPSLLPEILDRSGPLSVRQAVDGDPLRPGQVSVAPPNQHLLVDENRIVVTHGPRENRMRPSIDALFRSAAYLHRERVIGVVLSGLLDDGTSGLYTIKRRGGVAIVQSPEEAQFDSMPLSALREVEVDHCVPVTRMGALLDELVRALPQAEGNTMSEAEDRRLEVEVGISRGENAMALGVTELGEPSLLTCPECQGALVQFEEAGRLRFRCHTGHGYSGSSLLSEVTKGVEDKAYQMMRVLEESVMLMRRLGAQCEGQGDLLGAENYYNKAQEAEARASVVRALAQSTERLGYGADPALRTSADD
ncbi:chemotaxis protein CheB [Deinococcus hohokamensis]|uniref:protein-glutamate methylesterase n=1 Tax=Deinococcus hohokamensis TaxID=309883 RepID=A0ABV9I5A0_9DEIO